MTLRLLAKTEFSQINFQFFASHLPLCLYFFFFNDTATTEIYTLSLHDALPILTGRGDLVDFLPLFDVELEDAVEHIVRRQRVRSEEHTSELQSPCNLVCRLLLEKKKKVGRRVFFSMAECGLLPARSSRPILI